MLISFLRTVVLYLLLIVTVRLMGKRQIGEMEPAEFVVTMLLANLAAIPMQDSAIPLLSGLVPILVILGLELILAAVSLQSIRMRRLLCGKPVILMQNGKILERNLQRTRVNLDELTMHLREKGIFDLSTVNSPFWRRMASSRPCCMPKSSPLRRVTRASACGRRSCPSRSYLPGAFWRKICIWQGGTAAGSRRS